MFYSIQLLKCVYPLRLLFYFTFPSGFLSKVLCDKAFIYIGVSYFKTLIIKIKLLYLRYFNSKNTHLNNNLLMF